MVMDLKARLATLENQINSLQTLLKSDYPRPTVNNYSENLNNNNNINYNSSSIQYQNKDQSQINLKSILMKLKLEHETVLQSIEKALELVDENRTPERSNQQHYEYSSSPLRLRQKIINSVGTIHSQHNNQRNETNSQRNETNSQLNETNSQRSHNHNHTQHNHTQRSHTQINSQTPPNSRSHQILSSPLSSAVEKSHITFDILNDLDNKTPKRKVVRFKGNDESEENEEGNGGREMMSMASREYLKKYGLI